MNEVKYQATIDLSAKNNSHTIAFEFAQKVANGGLLNILEVGCSTGYFGSALKAVGHTVWGIEPNQSSATLAMKNLDYVFVGLIEDFLKNYPDKKFDLITFGDVLEHIADPSEVLNQCHHLLVEGGAIIASVPNVAHISVRAMLLEGRWEYGDLGILDRTHLRFFTKQTIAELFYDSKYSLVHISAVKLPTEIVITACNIQLSPKAITCADDFALDDRKYDFQYVLLAVPYGARQGPGSRLLLDATPIKVLGLVHEVTSSIVDVRIRRPLNAWASSCNGEVRVENHRGCSENSIAWADVIIIQRVADIYSMKILEKAKFYGKKVVFEIDDLLIELPDFLSHHKPGLIGYENTLNSILPQTDCITVTTKRLAKQFEKFSKSIAVIPNAADKGNLGIIDSSLWQIGQATLIVASTDSVMVDFILPAISEALKDENITVKVVVIGPLGNAFAKAGIRYESIPNMSYLDFKNFIRTLNNPIGIIPLDDSLFSSCKSPIKYFDYCLAGIPVICSNVPPYSDVIKNGTTGLLVNNDTESWRSAIEQLVMSVPLRKNLTEHATLAIEERHSMANTVLQWDLLFHKLLLGIYDEHIPTPISSFERKIARVKYLLPLVFSLHTYKSIIRIFMREGLKGLISRFSP